MPAIGELDRRISIEQPGYARDDFNADVPSFQPFVTVWAKRTDVSDGEKIAAGERGSSISCRFVIRSSSKSRQVTPEYRIVHQGQTFEITGIKQTQDGRDRFLELSATADADEITS
ncbi:phage head closure protein [uncultured Roseibium sp.]|uniref:phage head closure protein n=1 Tax=uncultured Roseibium sp. TaxID=1936171 RepID=UPI0026221712|nr:phage head closure protein [uncultured Roseibium sp.]